MTLEFVFAVNLAPYSDKYISHTLYVSDIYEKIIDELLFNEL